MKKTAGWIAAVSVIVGIVVWAVEPGLRLTTSTEIGLVIGLAGVAIAAGLFGTSALRQLQERSIDAARRQAEAGLASEHDRFLKRLNHELKNPVTAIHAAVATIEPGSPSVEVIQTQTNRISMLVDELRKIADLRTAPLSLEPTDLQLVLTDIAAALDHPGTGHGLRERDVKLDFPNAPWKIPTIQADSDLVYLALFNVMSNAVKFTQPGDTIEVRASDNGQLVTVEVADTGVGVPVQDQQVVWEELARGTNTRQIPGSGLGLSLIQVVVERHGGTATLISRDGAGTKVTLTFPIAGPSVLERTV